MKLAIIGAAGMLGFALHRVLHDAGFDVTGLVRDDGPPGENWCRDLRYVCGTDAEDGDAVIRAIRLMQADTVINAAGIKGPVTTAEEARRMLVVNAVFPRMLGAAATSAGFHFIHVSSDGVFSGKEGSYSESHQPDAADLYGMSKLLGEPADEGVLVLRTSMVGLSLRGGRSLVDWLLAARGPVSGFRRSVFSGLAVTEIAGLLARHVLPRAERLTGLFHVGGQAISKHELLCLLQSAWSLEQVEITVDDAVSLDRSLDSTRFREVTGYQAPRWEVMIESMRSFYAELDRAGERGAPSTSDPPGVQRAGPR